MQASVILLKHTDALSVETTRLNHHVSQGLALAIALTAAITGIVSGGSILFIIAGLAVAWLILDEPRFGLYLIVAVAAIDAVGYDPVTSHLARIYLIVPGTRVTMIELLVLWTCAAWALQSLLSGKIRLPDPTTLVGTLLVTGLVFVAIFFGVNRGANFNTAVWESRSLLLLLPVLLLTSGLITRRRHIVELSAVLVISLLLMSVEIGWRYIALVRPNETSTVLDVAFTHDGAMLVGVLAVLGVAGITWATEKKYRVACFFVFVAALVVVLATRRRAAVVGAEAGLLTLAIVLAATNWRRFLALAPIGIIIGSLYIAAFWNNPNTLGQPVRAIRTVIMSDSQSERDRTSDDYRNIETLDLWFDIKANPITGTGFGVAYAKPIPLTNLSGLWPMWDYIPHNNILWLWVKGGLPLFIAFWFLIGTAISRGVSTARKVESPLITAAIASICAYLVMSLMFAYVDLGLTSPRLMILLGMSLGLLSIFEHVWADTPKSRHPAS